MNRRRLLKLGATAVGGAAGYVLGKKSVDFLGWSLDAAVNVLYDATHAVATEIGGVAEKQLHQSAAEVGTYIGKKQGEYRNISTFWQEDPTYKQLSDFWNTVGLLKPRDHQELTRILDNVDRYTQEAHLGERLRRLRDRAHKQSTDAGMYLESKLPKPLRNLNEWVIRKLGGEEEGTRAAVENYRQRLTLLIQTYNLNQDNRLAQSHLLSGTADIFAQAQEGVAQHLSGLLDEGLIVDQKEQAFLAQTVKNIRSLGKEDPAGKKAEYLLGIMDYATILRASTDFRSLRAQLTGNLTDVTRLQHLLDEGIALKDEIRAMKNEPYETRMAYFNRLQTRFTAFDQSFEHAKGELERKGHAINYEPLQRYKEAKDAFLEKLHKPASAVGNLVGGFGALVGAGLTGYAAHKAIKSDAQISRRKFLGLERRTDELQQEVDDLRKLNKPLGE